MRSFVPGLDEIMTEVRGSTQGIMDRLDRVIELLEELVEKAGHSDD